MNDQAEEEGIKAIIGLQGLAGKVESEDQARAGWRAMKNWEKESTLKIYNNLCVRRTAQSAESKAQ